MPFQSGDHGGIEGPLGHFQVAIYHKGGDTEGLSCIVKLDSFSF